MELDWYCVRGKGTMGHGVGVEFVDNVYVMLVDRRDGVGCTYSLYGCSVVVFISCNLCCGVAIIVWRLLGGVAACD